MSEIITKTRIEDAIGNTNTFLSVERGAIIDGGLAAGQVAERVATVQQQAEDLLQSVPFPGQPGWYMPLSKYNADWYDKAVAVLPGYVVLVPSALVEHEPGKSVFYPAVVSEDGLKDKELRLHVLCQPYRQHKHTGLGYGASMVLSAAGQSETKGVGEHGLIADDSVEAEHFAALLAAGSDPDVQSVWQSGNHVNHTWRGRADSSVTAEVSKRLFGQEMPQATVTITRRQIKHGQTMVLWHKGMRDDSTGQPETAAKRNALVIFQALGFEALRARSPQGLDTVKRLIA